MYSFLLIATVHTNLLLIYSILTAPCCAALPTPTPQAAPAARGRRRIQKREESMHMHMAGAANGHPDWGGSPTAVIGQRAVNGGPTVHSHLLSKIMRGALEAADTV